ncbi:hypothetical protein SAMN04490190_2928 [Pseudomonas libanensis]|uniref:Uncharacterized protein n=1 Tax=Pseudomonas libanensis TaxID=75588 RepID=A0A0R2Y899_9PSED|nr:hypothetical protein [Pseudomonas libanensis]KRP44618.1 hypothetical protein TU73_15800 [Pseudomonas libanensis]SDL02482.1 hypothetical protein SAMN04490190_2928 [Pseudomonas libanensis]
MHEQARLSRSHATLGQIGDLVSIEDIEKIYPTSASANNAVEVECANPRCNVKVSITIIAPAEAKKDRKITPSSHFRGKHIDGCDRKPAQTAQTSSTVSPTQPAHPLNTGIPVVWADPGATSPGTGGSKPGAPGQINPSGTSASGRSQVGAGTSQSQSQRVEKFAKAWLELTQQARRGQPLEAHWNTEGTYASAFYPFDYLNTQTMLPIGERIHTASVVSGRASNGDFHILLKEQTASTVPKVVIVDAAILNSSAAGRTLGTQLTNQTPQAQKTYLFFFGAFHANPTSGQEELTVAHRYHFYVQT